MPKNTRVPVVLLLCVLVALALPVATLADDPDPATTDTAQGAPADTETTPAESDADTSGNDADEATEVGDDGLTDEERERRARELEAIFARMQEEAPEETMATGSEEEGGADETATDGEEGPGFVLNFENATISDFIQAIAEDLGFAYVLSPEVGEGTVTIRMPRGKTIRRSELFGVLLSVLELNNIVAIDNGSYYKIVPAPESKHRPIPTMKGSASASVPSDDRVITQIIPLDYLSPDEIVNTINPLISPDSTVISHPGSNLLIMTGLASNIRRLMQIIELLDLETAQLELEIFKIEYGDANDIMTVIDRIFSAQRDGGQTMTRRTASRRGRRQPAPSIGGGSDSELILIPDERSNSLIVFASRRDIEFIREIISMLDVNIYVTQKTYIYYVENANAGDMASLLGQIYPESGQTTRRAQPRGGLSGIGIGGSGVEGEVRVVADERTNALIIVTAPVNYPFILQTIEKLDILPKQVLIEVLILDVDIRDKSELGVQWTLRNQGSLEVGGEKYYFDGTARQNASLPTDIGFSYGLFEASRFNAFLRAYTQESRLEVLSNPHIMVANNTEAKIDVGNEIPIVTAETTTDVNTTDPTAPRTSYNRSIQYRSTGVLLTVTPHINTKRFVNMDVSQEVSNVSASIIAGIDSPVIETRRASTSVMVRDNETLVIGGMIRRSSSPSMTGVPVLSKIPFIGKLFGSSTDQKEATELLIFLTPHVIATPEEGAALALHLRDRLELEASFGTGNFLLEY